jgi:uncharacterized protein (DUF1501 family)
MLTRRDFLKASLLDASLLALAPAVPGFLAATARAAAPDREGRVLVVIQLDGGNDGINTVVPFADDGYARHRRTLRLDAANLIKISDRVGLHPSMTDAAKMIERGTLAIVQGVGYPNPSRSHFQSMAVWHTARVDVEEHTGSGWLGRVLDERLAAGDTSGSYFVGDGQPAAALAGRRSVAATLERLSDLALNDQKLAAPARALTSSGMEPDLLAFVRRRALDAYTESDRVAETIRSGGTTLHDAGYGLRGRLSLIAGLLKSGARARVYYTVQRGYDTHANQLQSQAGLLFELSNALKGFQDDLEASGLADRVLVMCFSEFGRRVAENGSAGTDHGTSGPVFLTGKHVRGGLIGETPSLLDLDGGDLKTKIDFRRVYAEILHDWFALPSAAALGGQFEPLPIIRKA